MSGAPKAYEMMSCFEGLCEMYRITGDPLYFEACHKLINTIIRDEIMIVGSGSMAEIWCHGKMRQTEPMYQGMETCVTATWMKFLYQMLRLTGDSRYADELETSLYNALLASMSPKGEWWSYYAGLMGERVHSHQQFPDVVMSCCVANGPRGLMITPSWAVMTTADGAAINLYGKMNSTVKTPSGQPLKINMESEYPVQGNVAATVNLPQSEAFALELRIPQWSKRTAIKINGEPYDGYILPGTYASIERTWNDNDKIEVELDMRARVVDAPSGVGDAAIGPRADRPGVRLAADSASRRRDRTADVPLRIHARHGQLHRRSVGRKPGNAGDLDDVRRTVQGRSGQQTHPADVRLHLGRKYLAGRQYLPRMGATAVRFPSPVHEQRGLARQRDRRRRASRDSGHL